MAGSEEGGERACVQACQEEFEGRQGLLLCVKGRPGMGQRQQNATCLLSHLSYGQGMSAGR